MRQHLTPLSIEAGDGRQHQLGIELVTENSPYGDGNVSRRQRGGRNLVEQWLEQVVVMPIDQRNAGRGMPQSSRASDTTESCSNDDDTGQAHEVKSRLARQLWQTAPQRCEYGAVERERSRTLGDQEKQEHRPIEREAGVTATHRVVDDHHDGKKGGCARDEPATDE